ncbi:phage terminase large subunit [Escherichia coli]|uniref:phage terminase large subunit n=1 Tax=Escherichia coli TaxID=562 RepID=UPI001FDAA09A|nr:phage terminase large subunit [Escherichia coli]
MGYPDTQPSVSRSLKYGVSFNPKNILDDTYQRFVVNPPDDICLLTVNYTDNPHFPEFSVWRWKSVNAENPTLYRHIWLGEPVSASDMAIIKREWLEAATDAPQETRMESERRGCLCA